MSGLGEPAAPAETTPAVAPASSDTAARWYAGAGREGEAVKDGPAPAEPIGAQETGAPEKYELALDGVELDPAMMTEAEPVLRELGLSNESANKLLPVANKLVSTAQDRMMQAMIEGGAKQKKEWLAAYNSDPAIGGANRAETQRLAERGMTALGFKAGHPFRQILTESGFGNHPDMIRTFRRLGELTGQAARVARPGSDEAKPVGHGWYGKGAN